VAALADGSLLAVLAEIPDPRERQGRRFPLVAMLAAVVCGILTGKRGYTAIAQWLKAQEPRFWHKLGFTRKPLCPNTFRDLLMALQPEQLETSLRKWMASVLGEPEPGELQAVCLDGKTLCGTLAAHERSVHLLSLLDQQTGCVLSQQAVDSKTNEHKAALEILQTLVLKGRLVTGDAMFCQRDYCQQVIDSGGDYFVVVKDNQPDLKEAIEAEFRPAFSPAGRETAAAAAL
jgi:DDE family transposase